MSKASSRPWRLCRKGLFLLGADKDPPVRDDGLSLAADGEADGFSPEVNPAAQGDRALGQACYAAFVAVNFGEADP